MMVVVTKKRLCFDGIDLDLVNSIEALIFNDDGDDDDDDDDDDDTVHGCWMTLMAMVMVMVM